MKPPKTRTSKLAKTIADLRLKLAKSEETLLAIKRGEVDALVVNDQKGDRVYTLDGAHQVYRILIETMSEGAAAVDRSGTILYSNRRLAEMLGRPADEIVGALFQSFLGEQHQEIFSLQLANNQPESLSIDVTVLASDGSRRPVHLSMAVLDFGNVAGVCLVATDMSYHAAYARDLAEKAEELSRSNSELERFAYVASHDLQEPLRMIGSFTQLLAKRYQGRLDADGDQFIGFVVNGVNQMQSLITDLLEYSRVGRMTSPFRPTDLEESLAHALGNLQCVIDESGVLIEHDPLPQIWGDPAQLLRLFQNLIGNAIKFRATDAPRINITALRVDDHWIVSVRDNGIGVDPRHFDRIFVLFQRLHDRSSYPGTGIGLAVCKKIVELHGGTIWLESQPGAGACFRFTLPIRGDITREPEVRETCDHDAVGR